MTLHPYSIALVVPAFNEENYLPKVLKKLAAFPYPVVLVDDGSSDQTASIARTFTRHTLVHSLNLGKGAALKTGCEYSFNILGVEGVVMLDSDDQHDPREIPEFADQLERGHDVVLGARKLDNSMPFFRVLANKLTSYITLFFFGVYIPDILCGYKALSREGYKMVKWETADYGVELEVAARVARRRIPFVIQPVSTIYHDLKRGMTILDSLAIMKQFLIWRFTL